MSNEKDSLVSLPLPIESNISPVAPLGWSKLGTLEEVIGTEAATQFFRDNPPVGSRIVFPEELPRLRPSSHQK